MNDRSVPIMDHIGEIKTRLIRSLLVALALTIAAFVFHERILEFLLAPAIELNPTTEGKPIFTELTEFWGAAAKVSVLTGFAASLPFLLWQVVMFLRPGLTPVERRYLYLLTPGGLLAFAAGVAFAYFVLLPPAINFLLSFGGDVATPLIRIGSYVTLITTLLFWMGLIFELPIVIFFLTRIGVINTRWLGRQRRWAILLAFVLGALITPTFDPINQSLVAGPVIVLFEVGYWLAKLGERGKARRDDKAAQATPPAEAG